LLSSSYYLSPFFLSLLLTITGKKREVMRCQIERNEGWRGGGDDWEEGGRGSEDD
jgi:hypothetical protein